MAASLSFIGHTCLGRTGSVKLSELNTTDAASRVYTTGSNNDLRRVNSNEVSRSQAPHSSSAQSTSAGTGANNSLDKWDGYLQWNASEELGTALAVSSKECRTYGVMGAPDTACRAIFSFTRPSGYTNFVQNSVQQQLLVKLCSDQSAGILGCDDDDDDPIDHGASYVLGDGASLDTGWLSAAHLQTDKWYIGTVRMQWNDERTASGTYIHSGVVYTPASASDPPNGIIFQMPAAPTCNGRSVGLGSSGEAACASAFASPVNGYQTTMAQLAVGRDLYESDCTTDLGHGNYVVWESTIDGQESRYSYSLSSGTVQNDADDCGGL